MKTITIYSLSDSRFPNEIRYVGKTTQPIKRRLAGHLCDAKKAHRTGYYANHNWNWIYKVISEGGTIVIEELDSIVIDDNEEWKWIEQYWISQCKTWGFNLTNITIGGDGHCGEKMSRESVEKRAQAIRGIPRDEETKRKISESHKGRPKSELHKQHVKEAMTNKFGIPIVQLDKNTREVIMEYPSIAIAADTIGKSKANIAKCCKHEKHFNTAYGYIWLYKDEYIV